VIGRLDSKGDVHLGDDLGMVDVNVDAVARGLLLAIARRNKPTRKRLPPPPKKEKHG
jgi:hypothetical protein